MLCILIWDSFYTCGPIFFITLTFKFNAVVQGFSPSLYLQSISVISKDTKMRLLRHPATVFVYVMMQQSNFPNRSQFLRYRVKLRVFYFPTPLVFQICAKLVEKWKWVLVNIFTHISLACSVVFWATNPT